MAQKTRAPKEPRVRTPSLKREQAVYERSLARWLKDHRNAYVLIKGDEVVGFYDTREAALTAGYDQFGVDPLLVKQVLDPEPIHYIPNVLL
jgi:hypothetical protein